MLLKITLASRPKGYWKLRESDTLDPCNVQHLWIADDGDWVK